MNNIHSTSYLQVKVTSQNFEQNGIKKIAKICICWSCGLCTPIQPINRVVCEDWEKLLWIIARVITMLSSKCKSWQLPIMCKLDWQIQKHELLFTTTRVSWWQRIWVVEDGTSGVICSPFCWCSSYSLFPRISNINS